MKIKWGSPVSPPFLHLLTVPHSFLRKAYSLTLMCLLSFRVWPQAEQLRNCKGKCIFAWRKSADHLTSLEGERTLAIAHRLLFIRSLGTMWWFIPIWTLFKMWTWLFTGLSAIDQGCLGADNYGTQALLTPFFWRRYSCYVCRITFITIKVTNGSFRTIPSSKLADFWLRVKCTLFSMNLLSIFCYCWLIIRIYFHPRSHSQRARLKVD